MDETRESPRESACATEQAAEWLERLKDPRPGDAEAFVAWLKDSRANVREALRAAWWESALGEIDPDRQIDIQRLLAESGNVVPLTGAAAVSSAAAPEETRRARWPRGRRIVLAAASAAIVLAAALLSVARWSMPQEYATGIGEQRTVELADGSLVALNARSTVRVKLSDATRDLYLSEGQAIFSVAHDEHRPFRVHVGTAVVQAIGTKFDVRRVGDRASVVVIEGKVRVTSEAAHAPLERLAEQTALAAGQAVNITTQGISVPKPVDVADATAWQQRRLKFLFTTLEEVVDEFNRFNRTPQIRIEGETLRARTISGVFEADDPESLVSSLASDHTVLIERRDEELVLRPRPVIVQVDETGAAPMPEESARPN